MQSVLLPGTTSSKKPAPAPAASEPAAVASPITPFRGGGGGGGVVNRIGGGGGGTADRMAGGGGGKLCGGGGGGGNRLVPAKLAPAAKPGARTFGAMRAMRSNTAGDGLPDCVSADTSCDIRRSDSICKSMRTSRQHASKKRAPLYSSDATELINMTRSLGEKPSPRSMRSSAAVATTCRCRVAG